MFGIHLKNNYSPYDKSTWGCPNCDPSWKYFGPWMGDSTEAHLSKISKRKFLEKNFFGEIWQCIACTSEWLFQNGSHNQSRMFQLLTPQLQEAMSTVSSHWHELEFTDIKLLESIGSVDNCVHLNKHVYPCQSVFLDGRIFSRTLLRLGDRFEIAALLAYDNLKCHLLSEVREIQISPESAPLTVRIASANVPEQRMGYSPLFLKTDHEKFFWNNGLIHFLNYDFLGSQKVSV